MSKAQASLILPIVGSRFHPPAPAILAALPVGHPLELRPEPENPHDQNVIAVWITGLPLPAILALNGDGLLVLDEYHLGYIPRERAADLHLPHPTPARFCLGARGNSVEFKV